MSIKAIGVKLSNYGPISKLECKFFDGITAFVGLNGSGKSKILESIIACVKGIAKNKGGVVGDRYRFIGSNGKSADIEYEFIDETLQTRFFIKNHITKQGNQISIKTTDNQPLGEEWLRSFLNISLMSATSFSQLSGKEQAELLGIDVSSFDKELLSLKSKATELNAELKAFGTIEEIPPVYKINVKELQEEEKKIEAELNAQYQKNRQENERRRAEHKKIEKESEETIKKWHDETHNRVEKKSYAEDALNRLKSVGYIDYCGEDNDVFNFIKSLPEPEPEPHVIVPPLELIEPEMPIGERLTEIREQINQAWENNAKYQEYMDYVRKVVEIENTRFNIQKNKEDQKNCIEERTAYLSSHNFGFKGLSVDENGELVLSVRGDEPRPLKQPYFSKGEMELIMAQLHIAMNPEFKVRFIDDFECITEPNDEKLLKMLLDAGFQVIVAEARNPGKRENEIVITEGKLQNNDNDERPEML